MEVLERSNMDELLTTIQKLKDMGVDVVVNIQIKIHYHPKEEKINPGPTISIKQSEPHWRKEGTPP